jgi:multidrug efflux pump subunit AcrA (membrane-fusion protein)
MFPCHTDWEKRRKRAGECKMKILKLGLIALILCTIAVPLIGCGKKTEAIPENQQATVQRGDLTVDITAAGNLALSYTAEPAFQIAGYVEEVFVEEGDTVAAGDVLATLDTTTLERTVNTAEIDLEKATNSYTKITYPYTYRTFAISVPTAIEFTSLAQGKLASAMEVMHELGMSREQYDWTQYWEVWGNIKDAQDDLLQVKTNLKIGSGPDLFGEGVLPMDDYWTLRDAQLDMEKAQQTLDVAKDELSKAVVVAPFAGFITQVNVEGGDEVYKGTVVAQVADPNRFEAEVMVNEMDIFQVKLGGDATVQIDAMPTLVLPAKVTQISPTATISSGVVNYKVKVEIQPQETVPTMLPEDIQLREGLSVTVSIIVAQRTGVLLVPNAAITTQQGQAYVQVVLPTGATEQRAIKTGLSNWQYTEVTEGLSEGETVVVPQGTTTTTPTSQHGGRAPMFFSR